MCMCVCDHVIHFKCIPPFFKNKYKLKSEKQKNISSKKTLVIIGFKDFGKKQNVRSKYLTEVTELTNELKQALKKQMFRG